ncbi:ARM repeat-containing protein [Serendipita vermifera]|nr:ARM repeat-containing protein [Serendipita vermifera]
MEEDVENLPQAEEDLPDWIEQASPHQNLNPEAPFGFCDPDVKAYFRTVDTQLREWQELGVEKDVNEGEDPNAERRMFFAAALSEMQGKELQLATDPDCAIILERMVISMDDLARRIFTGSLLGSIQKLAVHRFASHVLETLLESGGETIDRETRGVLPAAQNLPQFANVSSFTDLVSQMTEELEPHIVSLLADPFGSHVIQRLLILLNPSLHSMQSRQELRSKRSAAYKAKAGPMRSLFESTTTQAHRQVPTRFGKISRSLVHTIRDKLSPNEVRALAADKVACPTLKIIVALEAVQNDSDKPRSLMDHLLMGMISQSHESPTQPFSESDYIGTLLRDTTASHLLETVIRYAPINVLAQVWNVYFSGKLSRLAIHPVANFVVAAAIGKLDAEQLPIAIQEMNTVARKCFKQQRLGPITAFVDTSSRTQSCAAELVEMICDAVQVSKDDPKHLIPRLLYSEEEKSVNTGEQGGTVRPVSVQGALLLQSMLRLPEPHNELVINSFDALSPQERLALARDATSSRVVDIMLESPTVSRRSRRKVITSFIGHFDQLVDHRIGSWVGDRCWASADPYLREKIARSLIPHQQSLSASYYGKFFAKRLQLAFLQRKPDEWRAAQARQGNEKSIVEASSTAAETSRTHNPEVVEDQKKDEKLMRKRKRDDQKDEIDVLFDTVKENRFSKVATPSRKEVAEQQRDLDDVMRAIKGAPKGSSRKRIKA